MYRSSPIRGTRTKAEVRSHLAAIHRLVGRTPMIDLECEVHGRRIHIFAKNEIANFTGSIKDRMALHIIEDAHARGAIQPGDTIAEATSGNTGISFAAIGRALGHPVRIYMPDWMSQERVLVIKALGAEVISVSSAEGGFVGSIGKADASGATDDHVFLPHQFESGQNVEAHYRTTGPELLEQLARVALEPTAFVAGVGTGGTVMGVARLLRQRVPGIAVHPVEPANSPTLREGRRVGKHRIQGISDEFIPTIVQLSELDEIVDVWDGDAILMAQKLAGTAGLAVGISAGANIVGALRIALASGPEAVVATVIPDSNKKYLSTDLCAEEPVRDDYLAPHVEILGWRVLSGR